MSDSVVSNYNSNPPPDDGSETTANQLKWSTIKTKLTDPINTASGTLSRNYRDNRDSYELGSTAATKSHSGIVEGHIIETSFYNSSRVSGSGAEHRFTGTTTAGKAGNWPDADGYFYDADGKQFEILPTPKITPLSFGAAGDGATDDTTEVQHAWTMASGGPVTLPSGGTYVFSGRFDGSSGDIDLSPLQPGFLGRHYHYYEPQYDLSANALSVMHFFKTGTITIPASKQHNVLRFDGTVTNGDKFKGIDWQYTATDTTDAYAAIGLLINKGSGNTKTLYGRAQASTGCTGVLVGVLAATTVDSGIVPSTVMGLQISMDGTGTPTDSMAIRIDTAETSRTIEHGLLSLDEIQYSDAMIKGFNDGAGSFLKWQTPAGVKLFEVDKNGQLFITNSSNRVVFQVESDGDVIVGSTNDPQKVVRVANGSRTFDMQAVTTGDYWRVNAASVGELIKVATSVGTLGDCALSIRGNNTASGEALLQVSLGATDSGGSGFRALVVPN